jgi:hypothetical protein
MAMSSEQGHHTSLDDAIEHVVRDMMHVDPRPGLRLRVQHRMSQPPRRRSWVGLGALASAALVVLMFVLTNDRGSELQPGSPQQAAVESSPTPGGNPPGSETPKRKPEGVPASPVETARTAEPTPESIFGPRDQKVRGASTASSAARQPLTSLRLDVTVADDRKGVSTAPQAVSLVTADRQRGRVLASAAHAVLQVDAQPEILSDGRIRVHMTVSYQAVQQAGETSPPASLEKRITAIVDEGKTLNVLQSTDPASGRTVTVEIKATLLK